jgi:hypothetical protein
MHPAKMTDWDFGELIRLKDRRLGNRLETARS